MDYAYRPEEAKDPADAGTGPVNWDNYSILWLAGTALEAMLCFAESACIYLSDYYAYSILLTSLYYAIVFLIEIIF